jgi:tetratricopeptide (TPR) repeat protein
VLALGTEAIRRHRFAALVGVTALAVLLVLIVGGKAKQQTERADLEEKLKTIAAAEDVDAAVSEIEDLYAKEPDNPYVRSIRATIYRKRAMKTLAGDQPFFDEALKDFDRAGEKGSLWYLIALVETGRLQEAVAAAEALPEADPNRSLALARVALVEQRYADAIGLLPDPAAGPEDTLVLAALTRGLAHRGLGEREAAVEYIKLAFERSAGSSGWIRNRVMIAFSEAGGDFRDVIAALGRRTLQAVTAFADKLGDEGRFAKRLIDSVLTIAKESGLPVGPQAAVPSTQLEGIAKDRIAKSTGEERAVANLLLAIAEINLDRRDLAIAALDEAEQESAPALEPYVYWVRALVLRLDGNLPQAVESAQQAIELAMALPGDFPDLEHLCEHAALLAKEVPPDQKLRADEFLREKLAAMPQGLAWVSALLSRLSGVPVPPR